MIVECSIERRSNMRSDPSAPTVANISLLRAHAMSYTSLSCAMSWILTLRCDKSQIVHVVSMLLVPTMLGSKGFQSNEVNGAQYSLFLFCKIAKDLCEKNCGHTRDTAR